MNGRKQRIQFKYLQSLLLERRSRIVEQLQRAKSEEAFTAPNEPLDNIDEAWELFGKDLLVNISNKWAAELAEIDTALINIEKRDYGSCTYCGDPITPARLRAIPSTSHCIKCQEKVDNTQYYYHEKSAF